MSIEKDQENRRFGCRHHLSCQEDPWKGLVHDRESKLGRRKKRIYGKNRGLRSKQK